MTDHRRANLSVAAASGVMDKIRIVRTENLLDLPESNLSKSRSSAVNAPRLDMEATMHEQSYHTHACRESETNHRNDAPGFFMFPMGRVA